MKRLSLLPTTESYYFSSSENDESHELYPVLEEPEYMDESEEYTLEAAIERMMVSSSLATTATTTIIGTTTSTTSGEPLPYPNRNNKNSNKNHHHRHCHNNKNNNDNDDDTAAATSINLLLWRGGADETMTAIAQDRIVCHECFVCHETIFGLDDAAYLICPRCYTYCPNYYTTSSSIATAEQPSQQPQQQEQRATTSTALFGLALGFDIDTLWACQAEILLGRAATPK
jgi:hypothetical protein